MVEKNGRAGTLHSTTVAVPTTSVATPITKVTFTVTIPSATRLQLLNIKGELAIGHRGGLAVGTECCILLISVLNISLQ
jgi:hypothetical protein